MVPPTVQAPGRQTHCPGLLCAVPTPSPPVILAPGSSCPSLVIPAEYRPFPSYPLTSNLPSSHLPQGLCTCCFFSLACAWPSCPPRFLPHVLGFCLCGSSPLSHGPCFVFLLSTSGTVCYLRAILVCLLSVSSPANVRPFTSVSLAAELRLAPYRRAVLPAGWVNE